MSTSSALPEIRHEDGRVWREHLLPNFLLAHLSIYEIEKGKQGRGDLTSQEEYSWSCEMTAEGSAIFSRRRWMKNVTFRDISPCDKDGNVCSGINDTICIYSSQKRTLCS